MDKVELKDEPDVDQINSLEDLRQGARANQKRLQGVEKELLIPDVQRDVKKVQALQAEKQRLKIRAVKYSRRRVQLENKQREEQREAWRLEQEEDKSEAAILKTIQEIQEQILDTAEKVEKAIKKARRENAESLKLRSQHRNLLAAYEALNRITRR